MIDTEAKSRLVELLQLHNSLNQQRNILRRASQPAAYRDVSKEMLEEMVAAISTIDVYLVPANSGLKITMEPETIPFSGDNLDDIIVSLTAIRQTVGEHTCRIYGSGVTMHRKEGRLETKDEAASRYRRDLVRVCEDLINGISRDLKTLAADIAEVARLRICEIGLGEFIDNDYLHSANRTISNYGILKTYGDANSFMLGLARLNLDHKIVISFGDKTTVTYTHLPGQSWVKEIQ